MFNKIKNLLKSIFQKNKKIELTGENKSTNNTINSIQTHNIKEKIRVENADAINKEIRTKKIQSEIISIVERNPEMLYNLNVEQLEEINNLYSTQINELEEQIQSVQRKISSN